MAAKLKPMDADLELKGCTPCSLGDGFTASTF